MSLPFLTLSSDVPLLSVENAKLQLRLQGLSDYPPSLNSTFLSIRATCSFQYLWHSLSLLDSYMGYSPLGKDFAALGIIPLLRLLPPNFQKSIEYTLKLVFLILSLKEGSISLFIVIFSVTRMKCLAHRRLLYLFPIAMVTNYHIVAKNNPNLLSYSSMGQKSDGSHEAKIKMPARLHSCL